MGWTYHNLHLPNVGGRNWLRMQLVNILGQEPPGAGTGELASRHIYYVECLNSGKRIYLRRPANLHNGFDFMICVEGYNFAAPGQKYRDNPKHEDILADLQLKLAEEPYKYRTLYTALATTHACFEFSVNNELPVFESGLASDLIVKLMKWFFIEQDIRYWNYSGRDMLWSLVPRG